MPRVADHPARRAQIARAFRQHLVHHGLQATTFARVAALAGVSVGLIQHYFGTREALLEFVFNDALRDRDDRIALHIAEGDAADRPIRDILTTALRELLPLDAVRTEELHLRQTLVTLALHDPSAARIARRADDALQVRATIAVRNGQTCGEVAGTVDPEPAAARILATAHGLGTRLALLNRADARGSASEEHLAAVLDPVLSGVFTGRCRHDDTA